MTMMNDEDFKELVQFIDCDNAQARLQAAEFCAGMTAMVVGRKQLEAHDIHTKMVGRLKDDQPIAHEALKVLINMTTDKMISKVLNNLDAIKALFESGIMASDNKLHPLGIMLLANLTQHDESIFSALKFRMLLLEHILKFIRGEANHEAMSIVLCNLTRAPQGRALVADPKFKFVQALVQQVDSPSVLRRQGVVGALRNVAFDDAMHSTFLDDAVLTPLLLPLINGDCEFEDDEIIGMDPALVVAGHKDKKREPNPNVRRMLVEILSILQKHRDGREAIRAKQVYPILKRLDDVETDDEIREVICKVVSFTVLYDEETGKEKELELDENGQVPKSCPLTMGFQSQAGLAKLGIN